MTEVDQEDVYFYLRTGTRKAAPFLSWYLSKAKGIKESLRRVLELSRKKQELHRSIAEVGAWSDAAATTYAQRAHREREMALAINDIEIKEFERLRDKVRAWHTPSFDESGDAAQATWVQTCALISIGRAIQQARMERDTRTAAAVPLDGPAYRQVRIDELTERLAIVEAEFTKAKAGIDAFDTLSNNLFGTSVPKVV